MKRGEFASEFRAIVKLLLLDFIGSKKSGFLYQGLLFAVAWWWLAKASYLQLTLGNTEDKLPVADIHGWGNGSSNLRQTQVS